MSIIRQYSAGIVIDYNIVQGVVVTPGSPSPNVSKRLDCFSLNTETWSQLADMNLARAGFDLHFRSYYLYAIGGTDGSIIHKSVEMFDINTNTWIYKEPMTEAKCFFQSAFFYRSIWVIGGITVTRGEINISRTVEVYDTENDTWTSLEPLPEGHGVAFGFCHYRSGKIYLMNGYLNTIGNPNTHVFIYDISLNTWTVQDSFTEEEKGFYTRLLPFHFYSNNYIYGIGGLLQEVNNLTQPPTTTNTYVQDAYRYNVSTGDIEKADHLFADLPKSRYGGGSAKYLTYDYFLGGIDKRTNTIKYFDRIDETTSPFTYSDYNRLLKGRSVFGIAMSQGRLDSPVYMYVAGGVVSNQQENYLFVLLDSLAKTVSLNGKETAAISVRCTDESGETPDNIEVQLTGTTNDNKAVLFTSDRVFLEGGYGLATLLPRSEDADSSVDMTDIFSHEYQITIKGSVLNDEFYGESTPLPPSNTTNQGGTASTGGSNADGSLPEGVILLKKYTSVITTEQQSQGAILGGGQIGGIISLQAYNNLGSGQDTSLTYSNKQPWLPVVVGRLIENAADYTTIKEQFARMKQETPFGGSPMLDALEQSFDILEFDVTNAKRNIYLQTDGEENCSHSTVNDVIARMDSVTGQKRFPIISSVFKVVPYTLHLDQSIRDGSDITEELAEATGGSSLYVISDADVDRYIRGLLTAKGFIGSGIFTCNIDLGEEVRIESIIANFDIPNETSAFWRYSIGDDEGKFTLLSERAEPNQLLTLYKTNGRTVKFVAEFFANLDPDLYNAELISPPKLTSIVITYHKKTTSYAYLTPSDTDSEVHNIVITLDATAPEGSDINVAATSEDTKNWNNFISPSKPATDNSTRIVIPIRKAFDPIERYTLEALVSIDGFIHEAKYGKWPFDSDISVFDENGEPIDSGEYRIFPNKGYVVFNSKRTDQYTIEIRNREHISVAAEIINRVNGEPVVITGAGYMYSTLDTKFLSKSSNVLPEAINLLLTPQNPNKDSIFTANWTFYDLKGRSNKNSEIKWYINDIVQVDIENLQVWDNKVWKLAKSGDSLYFTVLPKASDGTDGRITRSIPVRIS